MFYVRPGRRLLALALAKRRLVPEKRGETSEDLCNDVSNPSLDADSALGEHHGRDGGVKVAAADVTAKVNGGGEGDTDRQCLAGGQDDCKKYKGSDKLGYDFEHDVFFITLLAIIFLAFPRIS
jgi:hypothetical protein